MSISSQHTSKLLIHSIEVLKSSKIFNFTNPTLQIPIFAFYISQEISRDQKTIMNNTEFPKALRRRLNTYWFVLS